MIITVRTLHNVLWFCFDGKTKMITFYIEIIIPKVGRAIKKKTQIPN